MWVKTRTVDADDSIVASAHDFTFLRLNGFSKMNMNFFQWLRDGVRQSVILGVGDAVEQIGVPETDQEVQPTLAALLGDTGDTKTTKPRRKSSNGGGRKRLGKSLKELNPTD